MLPYYLAKLECSTEQLFIHSSKNRLASPEISSETFLEISIFPEISGKFPEIFTEYFPPVQTFQLSAYFAHIFTFYRLLQHLWSLVVY